VYKYSYQSVIYFAVMLDTRKMLPYYVKLNVMSILHLLNSSKVL
jgi:hypothetical protein